MKLLNNKTTTVTIHEDFYAIAHQNYTLVYQLVVKRDSIVENLKGKEKITEAGVLAVANKNRAIERHAMLVVIFSALTLEAFINHYAIENFSESYLKNYLDKLDPVSKWVVIPKLVLGRALDTGGRSFELLQRLFLLRNKLVHYKTRIVPFDELRTKVLVGGIEAEEAIQAVWDVIGDLSNLDSNQTTEWLKQADETTNSRSNR
jgi:hypothetical protein